MKFASGMMFGADFPQELGYPPLNYHWLVTTWYVKSDIK